MNTSQAIAFVEKHGIVLQSARGVVPSLVEAIAGERIRGSWWAHPKSRAIYRVIQGVCDSPDVLVCKLIDGKVTLVHRRLWPALVRLSEKFPKERLAKVWDEHTESGAHVARSTPFPEWVPAAIIREAKRMPADEAERLLTRFF